MAQDSFQEKTEQATPKRLEESRGKGSVPKSIEFNSAFVLFFALLTLYFFSTSIVGKLGQGFKVFYQEIGTLDLNMGSFQYYTRLGVNGFLGLLGPFLGIMMIVGIGVNVSQFGFLFSIKALKPDFKRVNPIAGFKKFFSLRSLIELAKGILKLLIVSAVAYWTIMEQKDRYLFLVNDEVGEIMQFLGAVTFQIFLRTTIALLGLAIVDLLYQRWQYKKDMMMTKQEVKEEQKQAEGDPLVKSTIRSLQQSRSRNRMMDSVPDADVVVTNPTQFAVALKYEGESMSAPVVLAKGARLLAQKIREIAEENEIPIVENKPLAQSLYKTCEVGKEVSAELFHAVAEVLAHVYQMKGRA